MNFVIASVICLFAVTFSVVYNFYPILVAAGAVAVLGYMGLTGGPSHEQRRKNSTRYLDY
jgi:hypothetical protein